MTDIIKIKSHKFCGFLFCGYGINYYICIIKQFKTTTMYTKDYLNSILAPFESKRMRMRNAKNTNGLFVEPSMESDFSFEVDHLGISFFQKGFNVQACDNIDLMLRTALKDAGITMRDLEMYNNEGKTFGIMKESMKNNYKIQVARIYFASISSVEVNKYGFTINGIELFIN